MIGTIQQFFTKHIKTRPESSELASEHSLMIATAALLIEMMRADSEITDEEQEIITERMKSSFRLSDEETTDLLKLAEDSIWESNGYFEFTSLMNRGFGYEEKIRVIEYLWEVAFADGILSMHEEYMVRKIANLIHVAHRDFIDAKLRVRQRMTDC